MSKAHFMQHFYLNIVLLALIQYNCVALSLLFFNWRPIFDLALAQCLVFRNWDFHVPVNVFTLTTGFPLMLHTWMCVPAQDTMSPWDGEEKRHSQQRTRSFQQQLNLWSGSREPLVPSALTSDWVISEVAWNPELADLKKMPWTEASLRVQGGMKTGQGDLVVEVEALPHTQQSPAAFHVKAICNLRRW